MPSWNSRGLRGSMLEEALNMTNEQYRKEHLALVQKIPTPITPINIDKEHRHITLAYFEQKSTVDYIGNVQGVPICFDAKECAGERFALQNIHEHQMEYMQDFERQDGIAFLIVYFKEAGAYYYVPFRDVKRFWDRAAWRRLDFQARPSSRPCGSNPGSRRGRSSKGSIRPHRNRARKNPSEPYRFSFARHRR